MRLARPAFATQEEALARGVYGASLRAPAAVAPLADSTTVPAPPMPAPTPGAAAPWAIQIAAFRDAASARALAAEARRHFATRPVQVVPEGALHRVLLVGWESNAAAERDLATVRAVYPSSWVRLGALP